MTTVVKTQWLSNDAEKSFLCERVLRALPEWFGIETATRDYIEGVKTRPMIILTVHDVPVGFISFEKISKTEHELYVLGVLPEHHRKGYATRMLSESAPLLWHDGVRTLRVKTLSTRHPDKNYEKTRLFYESVGFKPLEEIDIWGPANPCLVMIKDLQTSLHDTDKR